MVQMKTTSYLLALPPEQFRRLIGVNPDTFLEMVEAVKHFRPTKKLPGRPSVLTIEDRVRITLSYWREYRTYFHIAQD